MMLKSNSKKVMGKEKKVGGDREKTNLLKKFEVQEMVVKSILFVILLFTFACQNNDSVKVTIEIHAPATADTTEIFITGNNPQMGNWQPDKVLLNNIGEHLWRKSFRFRKGAILEYKITQGSFDNEVADDKGRPFQNSVLKINNDTTAQTSIFFWKNGRDFEIAGQITGEVRYHRQLKAHGLLPRDIIIWLPPGYKKNTERRYPVLYMHDGQNIVDPQTAAFKVDWQIDETAYSLIRAGEIEPLLIVGIYNTAHRSPEYTPTPKGDLYRAFVVNTVKPLIDKTYRTKPGPEFTAVGGSSLGGIVSFMLAWENSDVFSKAICMSPAFKIQDIDYVRNVRQTKGNKKDIHIYIYNGGVGLEVQLQPGIDNMMHALDMKGYQQGNDYFWFNDKGARHFEAAWAAQMPAALRLFYGVN